MIRFRAEACPPDADRVRVPRLCCAHRHRKMLCSTRRAYLPALALAAAGATPCLRRASFSGVTAAHARSAKEYGGTAVSTPAQGGVMREGLSRKRGVKRAIHVRLRFLAFSRISRRALRCHALQAALISRLLSVG